MAFSLDSLYLEMSRMAFVAQTGSNTKQVDEIDHLCSKLFHIRDQLTEQHLPSLRILQERYHRLHPKIHVPPLINAIYNQVLQQANGDSEFLLKMTERSFTVNTQEFSQIAKEYLSKQDSSTVTSRFVKKLAECGNSDWHSFIPMHQLALFPVSAKRQDSVIRLCAILAVNGVDVSKLILFNDHFQHPFATRAFFTSVYKYNKSLENQLESLSLDERDPCQIQKALDAMLDSDDASSQIAISDTKKMPKIVLAALLGRVKTAKKLAKTHDIHEADSKGYTACHMAAMCGNWRMLELLLSLGGDFSCKTKSGHAVYDLLQAQGFAQGFQNASSSSSSTTGSLSTPDALFQAWLTS